MERKKADTVTMTDKEILRRIELKIQLVEITRGKIEELYQQLKHDN
jgi:transcriptional regulator of acetoin/glycerol metabolism